MLLESQLNEWYALFVVSGDEDNVKERIKYRFQDRFNVLVPKRKLKERKNGAWKFITRNLFPGYVLLNGIIDEGTSMSDFKNIPGLLKLLKSGSDILKIDYNEIAVLSRLICNSEIIGFSDIMIENGKVRVIDGPLLSMEGIILSVDQRKGRARVSLNFLGDARTVELGVSVLRPIN